MQLSGQTGRRAVVVAAWSGEQSSLTSASASFTAIGSAATRSRPGCGRHDHSVASAIPGVATKHHFARCEPPKLAPGAWPTSTLHRDARAKRSRLASVFGDLRALRKRWPNATSWLVHLD